MVRDADGFGEKAKREKEDTVKEERRASETMRTNEKVEVSTSELREAEDHFEL